MTSRDSLDEILEAFRKQCVSKVNTGSGFEVTKQAIHQWALDIIGADEKDETDKDEKINKPEYLYWMSIRNALRKEQRAKLKGDIDEPS